MCRASQFPSSLKAGCLCLAVVYSLIASLMVPVTSARGPLAPRSGRGSEQKNSTKLGAFPTPPLQQSGVRHRNGELLVRFRAGSSEQDQTLAIASQGASRKRKLWGESGVEKLELSAGQDPETVSRLLALNPAVEFAEPNFVIERDDLRLEGSVARRPSRSAPLSGLGSFDPRTGVYSDNEISNGESSYANSLIPFTPTQSQGIQPDDPRFSEQWALRNTGQNGGQYGSDIGATAVWQTTTGSQSTVIAVIDSGIDFTHPDLSNNQWTNPAPGSDLHGWDYITDTGTIRDEQGHGTAIAGIIAAHGNNTTGISGVMWQVSLMSLRVLDNTGTGDVADAVEAIDYAATHGAQVINISWGTSGESIALKDAIERAIRRGSVVVCSAGNGGQDVEQTPYYPASHNTRDLIVVASTDNFDQLSSWSNWGRRRVTVAAPGTNILTTQMGGSYWLTTGTSASAPLVSGVIGLIKSKHPGLDARSIEKGISDGVRQVASLSGKVSSGGVVNASGTLEALRGVANQPPTFPRPGYGSGGQGPDGTFSTTPPPRTTGAPASNLPNLDQARNARPEQPRAKQPIQSNLVCADCDPQGGGEGGGYYPTGDPNFSTARERPLNETGEPGVDLGSRNFNWSLPLVSLAGRAGLDLNLALFYNSLVWTKDGSYIKYNADLGSPASGFRVGLPTLQQRFWDSQTGAYAYMMVTSSGGRVEMRQVDASNIYEALDGSYTQLDVTNVNAPVVRTTDGTQLTFSSVAINSEYRCTEIKDRNGNYISATYNTTNGHLLTITDTLGRVITFVYDGNNNLQVIRQTWAGVSHDWATFTYGEVYVAPNFRYDVMVNGPNNNYLTVLTQVSLHDGSYFTFNYNAAFGQVNRINHYAADAHLLGYTAYNLNTSSGQIDCPRFTERYDWAQYWNGDTEGVPASNEEVTTYYTVAGDNSWSQQQTTTSGPIHKEFFAISGWQSGLTASTEDWSGGVKQKWTTVSWTQDDTNLSYPKNPRPTETNIYDVDGNRKRITINYGAYASYSLPYEVTEYAADGSTPLRKTYTDYNLDANYLNRRIFGLVSSVKVFDSVTSSYVSKTTFDYDTGGEYLTAQSATQHDDSGYGTGLVAGRGNQTAAWRWDVTDIDTFNKAIPQQRIGYNTTGSVVFSRDALGHQITISYADAFSDPNKNGGSFAYPTTVTDADGFPSTVQYNFDFGAVTRTQDSNGAVQTKSHDSAGRVLQVTNSFNNAYTRWVYASAGYVSSYAAIGQVADEAFSLQVFDGAGRVYMSASNSPNSVGGYNAQSLRYDSMGRLQSQSNPTEVNWAWVPAGDDAAGWTWTSQTYDWKGRPLVTTNADGSTHENTYGGCGCAGGEVTTARDERGRRRKLTKDVLGRLKQVDELNWDQSVYATTTYAYNALDQLTSSSQTGQPRTLQYDGYGRLWKKTTPEQGLTEYNYNANDTVNWVKDARLVTSTFTYNNRNLPTAITHNISGDPTGQTQATSNVSFGYDSAGNRTSMTDGLGSVSYVYDTISRLTSETRTFTGVGSFALSYGYNLAGEVTSVTGPSQFGSVNIGYGYDIIGRATGVTGANYASGTSYVSNITYRAFGMKQMSYSNAKTLSLQYDNRMRVTSWNVPGALGWNYAYNYFGENTGRATFASNLTSGPSGRDASLDRSYDYDHLGRLLAAYTGTSSLAHTGQGNTWGGEGPYAQDYGYDVWGNITHRGGWGGVGRNENLSYTNNRQAGMAYDAAGNVVDGTWYTFSYDATGQQTRAACPGYVLDQAYDGDRLRGKKVDNGSTTYYLRSSVLGGQVVAELDGNGAWTRGYVYLGGQMVALQGGTGGAVSWVHQDPVTKSQRITNSSGTVVSTVDLDPFGGDTSRNSNAAFQPHRYTSYERDVNGADDAMMRRYNRYWGRFDQPDPYDGSYEATNPQSLNRYAYVNNDPVNFVDPSGLNLAASGDTACFGTDVSYYLDGVLTDARTVCSVLQSGGGVVGPASTTRYNPGSGTYEFFRATGNSSGWIPMGAHYIGGLSWGWTDYSRAGAPSYTYSFTEDRLSTLTMWNGRFGWDGTVFRGVDGYPYEKGGLDMHPAVDPVWLVAGVAEGLFRAGAKAGAQSAIERQILIKSEHFFAQHFAGTVITEAELNAALRQSVQSAVRGASNTGSFWGRMNIRNVLVEYHAYTLPGGRISVGTAYPWPK